MSGSRNGMSTCRNGHERQGTVGTATIRNGCFTWNKFFLLQGAE